MNRRTFQQQKLIADGHKALGMLKTHSVVDISLLIGGGRTRLYRAMAAARAELAKEAVDSGAQGDPLLL